MAEVKLEVESRDANGKKGARKLRRDGKVPAVYYIHGEAPKSLAVSLQDFHTVLAGDASVIDLSWEDGKKLPTIIRDIQWDPVSNRPIHVDFLGVRMDEKITAEVAIQLDGDSIGVKNGGTVQFLQRSVEVECLPLDIPEALHFDVSNLDIQDTATVADLVFDKGVILTDKEATIVSVLPPRLEEITEEAEAEAEEPAEEEPASD